MKKIIIKKIQLSDIKLIFNLYNSIVNDGFSTTKKKISYEKHKVWFLNSFRSKNVKIFICHYGSKKIGYLRFNKLDQISAKISIVIKEAFRGKGIASILLYKSTKIAFKNDRINQIYAEVLKKNHQSIKFFLNNGYKMIKFKNKFKNIFKRNNYIFLKKINK